MSVYMPMDCDGFAAALADYLEGDAPSAVRAAIESHAAACAECGALLADLRAIPQQAAALPALAPSHDLWSGIAERIDARVLPLERPATRTIVPARRSWARPAIAAAALMLITAGVTHYATRSAYDKPAAVAAQTSAPSVSTPAVATPESLTTSVPQVATNDVTSPTPSSPDPSSGSAMGQSGAQRTATRSPALVAAAGASTRRATSSGARLVRAEGLMEATEPVYDKEISKLRTIVKSRRADLDPRTIAVLEQSIAVIDSAIAQSRSALAKDPASGFLANQLNHSLEKKVELLRTAAMLPART